VPDSPIVSEKESDCSSDSTSSDSASDSTSDSSSSDSASEQSNQDNASEQSDIGEQSNEDNASEQSDIGEQSNEDNDSQPDIGEVVPLKSVLVYHGHDNLPWVGAVLGFEGEKKDTVELAWLSPRVPGQYVGPWHALIDMDNNTAGPVLLTDTFSVADSICHLAGFTFHSEGVNSQLLHPIGKEHWEMVESAMQDQLAG
jgi:hypothetical protein